MPSPAADSRTQCTSTREGPALASLELFCGGASLSFALKEAGFVVTAVDRPTNEHRPLVAPLPLDLTQASAQRKILDDILEGRYDYVHMSPPCGTASRARERPISRARQRAGVPNPKPLRSEAFPRGLPGLEDSQPRQVVRVHMANILYDFVCQVAHARHSSGTPWTLENPGNSLFWWIPDVIELLSLNDVNDVFFRPACTAAPGTNGPASAASL